MGPENRSMPDGERRDRQSAAQQKALLEQMRAQRTLTDPRVERAMRAMPRHWFLPQFPLDQVYLDRAIQTKQDGEAQSACSQPAVVALMLEQIDLRPGERVLEIGAGTGWNAALMSYLVGPTGRIVTIDIDEDTVHSARENLGNAGAGNVEVFCADGGFGNAESAPYDAIIATAGIEDITPYWFDQLREGGRLLAPMAIDTCELATVFHKRPAQEGDPPALVSQRFQTFFFMPLRGRYAGGRTWLVEPGFQVVIDPAIGIDAATVLALLRLPPREKTVAALLPRRDTSLLEYMALQGEPMLQVTRSQGQSSSLLFCLATAPDSLVAIPVLWDEGLGRRIALPTVSAYGSDAALVRLLRLVEDWEAQGQPGLAQARLVVAPHGALQERPGAALVRRRWMDYRVTFG